MVKVMKVKAIYTDHTFKPINNLENLHLSEGEEREIIKSPIERISGLLKDIDLESVELQHKAGNMWVKKSGSPQH